MATVLGGNAVRLQNGKTIQAAQGAWYDGQQFWNGTLSTPGVINSQSNQQGAGQAVSNEVIAQTNPANVAYIQKQQAAAAVNPNNPAAGGGGPVVSDPTVSADGNGGMGGMAAPKTIDLNSIYQNLTDTSGVAADQEAVSAADKKFLDAQAKLTNNPFSSAGSMDMRIARLTQQHTADTQPLLDKIAMKKADIQTQLDIQTKQFDINSQAAQQAFSQFNSLLASGALSGATGNDIASITAATGVSSSMIQAAIKAQNDKNAQTQVIQSTDNAGNVTVSVVKVVNGELQTISSQSLGKVGKADTSTGSKTDQEQAIKYQLAQDAKSGVPLINYNGGSDILSLYSKYLDPNTIYQIYNSNSSYGPAKEKLSDLAKYGIKDINKDPFGINPSP